MLSTITLLGRPTRDPELRLTKAGKHYVRLDIAVNKGYDANEHVNYYQCWFQDEEAERVTRAGVKKGSLLHLSGDLDVKPYTKNDGTQGTALNVKVYEWSYASSGKAKAENTRTNPTPTTQAANPPASTIVPPHFEEIDDDDDLPF